MLKDADIREPLFDFLDDHYGKNRILEEINIENSRADVIMVTENHIYGIEIKSDADNYSRLRRQIKNYDKHCDYNYVVVGTSHAAHIEEHIPEYWGIITVEEVDGEVDFYLLRQPRQNPNMKLEYKIRVLWKPELAEIQKYFGMPKYKHLNKRKVIERILQRTQYPEGKKGRIEISELMERISYQLLERDYNQADAMIQEYYG